MRRRSEVHVVRTSTANLAAVQAALDRTGSTVVLTDDAGAVREAERVVLPGVGAFGAAWQAIESAGLEDALRGRIEAGRPTLAICLGLQLLAEGSEEAPGLVGLSLVPGTASRFDGPGLRVPQMGWNRVTADPECRIVPTGYAYFANTYRLTDEPVGWNAAWSVYGSPFVAAVERGGVVACQFHPELSGAFGRQLLQGWLEVDPC